MDIEEDEVGEEFNFRVGVESGEGFKDWETGGFPRGLSEWERKRRILA